MHCPGCGQVAPANQKFCRSCGLDLREISQIVKGRAPNDDFDIRERSRGPISHRGYHAREPRRR